MLPQLASVLPVARAVMQHRETIIIIGKPSSSSGNHHHHRGNDAPLQVYTAQNHLPGNRTTAANNQPAANVAAVNVLML
jgi:hypothetical protein